MCRARNVLYFAYSNDGIAEEPGSVPRKSGFMPVWQVIPIAIPVGWIQGEETFYGYAYAVDAKHGEWIPDKTYKMDVQEFAIYTSVGNASSVGWKSTPTPMPGKKISSIISRTGSPQRFHGCSDASSGVRGFVPAPGKGTGKSSCRLRADGKGRTQPVGAVRLDFSCRDCRGV